MYVNDFKSSLFHELSDCAAHAAWISSSEAEVYFALPSRGCKCWVQFWQR